jgi:glucokinase
MSSRHPSEVRLIADIGGTNARFALIGTDGAPRDERALPGADYPDIVSAIEAYLAQVDTPRPSIAAIAIANPITGDRVKMTNHSWEFSIEETRQRLGLNRLLLINDFTAQAMAVPWLAPADVHVVGGGTAVENGAMGVLGPGTGLGVSGLIRAGDLWIPLQGEGGHVSVSPGNPREAEILRVTWQRFEHVSAERLVSGMGLQNLHHAISVLEGRESESLTPAEISQRGQDGADSVCAEALETFCALLGSVAGNLALTLGATGGVYIGGGIVSRLGNYFDTSPFRQRFEAKGRFAAYLAAIPTYVIHARNPAFTGIAKVFGPYRSMFENEGR